MRSLLRNLQKLGVLLAVVLLCVACSKVPTISDNPWEMVSIPTASNLSDVAFTGNENHGWIVGSNTTLLESTDGGETWQPKILDLGEQKYRFSAVSFSGQEGWIAGQPSLLLRTTDEGKTWSRITLSEKLPGNPNTIIALGSNSAEMTTDVGAIYRTTDGGKTWKAMVEEAVGVVRNIARSDDGKYVAVSSRGNFYSTWEPGQNAWLQHNRNSSRRVQNMGFSKDGRLWMLARGGQLQFTDPEDPELWLDAEYPEFSTSWGLLDVAYRTPDELWVAGGSGNLLRSLDGGKSWEKDRQVEDVPSNLYRIVFLSPKKGFIIGQNGTVLRYNPNIVGAA